MRERVARRRRGEAPSRLVSMRRKALVGKSICRKVLVVSLSQVNGRGRASPSLARNPGVECRTTLFHLLWIHPKVFQASQPSSSVPKRTSACEKKGLRALLRSTLSRHKGLRTSIYTVHWHMPTDMCMRTFDVLWQVSTHLCDKQKQALHRCWHLQG